MDGLAGECRDAWHATLERLFEPVDVSAANAKSVLGRAAHS